MHQETTTRPSAVPIRSGIVMLSGYGIRVSVESPAPSRQPTGSAGSAARGALPRRRAGSNGLSSSRRPAS